MKKRILIIEDQPQMLRNLALMLSLEGYEVFTAANGRLGVETAIKQIPDLVICDVMMPELDGHGVVQALRAEEELHVSEVFRDQPTNTPDPPAFSMALRRSNPAGDFDGGILATIGKPANEI